MGRSSSRSWERLITSIPSRPFLPFILFPLVVFFLLLIGAMEKLPPSPFHRKILQGLSLSPHLLHCFWNRLLILVVFSLGVCRKEGICWRNFRNSWLVVILPRFWRWAAEMGALCFLFYGNLLQNLATVFWIFNECNLVIVYSLVFSKIVYSMEIGKLAWW